MANPTRILIADPNEEFSANLAKALATNADFSVLGTAVDGEKAVEFLENTPVDVLILDLTLPKLDGISVLKRANALETYHMIKIMQQLKILIENMYMMA